MMSLACTSRSRTAAVSLGRWRAARRLQLAGRENLATFSVGCRPHSRGPPPPLNFRFTVRRSSGVAATKEIPPKQRMQQEAAKRRRTERQSRHHERLRAAARAKRDKTVRDRRASAASALTPILGSDSACYEATVSELLLSLEDEDETVGGGDGVLGDGGAREVRVGWRGGHRRRPDRGEKVRPNAAALARYRQLYLDSIPSFAMQLRHDPGSVFIPPTRREEEDLVRGEEVVAMANDRFNDIDAPATTDDEDDDAAERLLDELADAGFADRQFTRKYRKMVSHSARIDEMDENVSKRRIELDFLTEKIEREEAELRRMLLSEDEGGMIVAAAAAKTMNGEDVGDGEVEENRDATSSSDGGGGVWSVVSDAFRRMVGGGGDDGTLSAGGTTMTTTSTIDPPRSSSSSLSSSILPDRVVDAPVDWDRSSPHLLRVRNRILSLERRASAVSRSIRNALKTRDESDRSLPLSAERYREARRAVRSVVLRLCPGLAAHMAERHAHMIERFRILDQQTDLTKPHEWYPYARLDRRKIIFHGGPTNSGKTYEALRCLKDAAPSPDESSLSAIPRWGNDGGRGRGLYVGPLRLLAAEVYETLTSDGVYTNLLTGQDKRAVPFATHTAATVEMAPIDEEFDVAVIDEVQMLADPFRGFAWTRALLGLRCKEIHVCGGLEAQNLVQKIAQTCGDEFELRTYSRFSEIHIPETSLSDDGSQRGSYGQVQPGDCVVAFSRNDIFAIKREIETLTSYKCCVIYGSLPPEIRTDQARRFNDPNSGYDVLVASDAIGMGLNLNIRRIIFNSMFKSNGEAIVRLDHSSVKQIGGRAGRRNSPYPVGEVTCRDPEDMDHLRTCLTTDIPPITSAGLLPTVPHIEQFCAALQKFNIEHDFDNLYKILRQFNEMATLQGDYFLCRKASGQVVSKWMEKLPLTIGEKYTISISPVNHRDNGCMKTLQRFVKKYTLGETPGLNRGVYPTHPKSFDDLDRLCSIYSQLELFLWLSLRFTSNLVEQQTAETLAERTTELINQGLAESENLKLNYCYIKKDARLRRMWLKGENQGGSASSSTRRLRNDVVE